LETLTFLLTDIEGSTALFERTGEAFSTASFQHFALLRTVLQRHGGEEFPPRGDGLFGTFASSSAALSCAIECQQVLAEAKWPTATGPLRVRMGLHRGEVMRGFESLHGLSIHHATRVLDAGHGGQILCSAAVRDDLPAAMQATLADLGSYRFRGVAQPVRVFEAMHPARPAAGFPPLRAPSAFTHQLPVSMTRFFGREAEIAELAELLTPGAGGRLITLTGPGGAGKTRLSLAVAERLVPAYLRAVWFVSLAELRDGSLLLETVRDALGLVRDESAPALDRIVELLGAQPSLVVLDNFEHLVPAGVDAVRRLRERLPGLAVLVSSRLRLGLAGEIDFAVRPLPLPDASTALGVRQCPSVGLFIDRASAARIGFEENASCVSEVAQICRTLEGMPLAIELAAARVRVLSPKQILEHLHRGLSFLVSRDQDVPDRHRTLSAAVEWSFKFLNPRLRRTFARLAIFSGGWTLDAADAVAAEEGSAPGAMLADLEELQAASLVIAEERDGEMRYRMLEIIRDYARSCLAPDELAAVAARHHRYFAEFARRAWGQDEARRLRELEADHDNLRAMLGGAGPLLERSAAAVRLHRFWLMRGHLREGRGWLEQFAGAVMDPRPRSGIQHAAGILACSAGDYADGRARLLEALKLYGESGDERNVAAILNSLGLAAGEQCDFAEAAEFFARSLVSFRRLGLPSETAVVLSNIGQNTVRQGDLAAARTALDEALAIQLRLGDRYRIAQAMENLAEFYCASGDYAAARAALAESIGICETLGSRDQTETVLGALVQVALGEGMLEVAARLHGAAFSALADRATTPSPAFCAQLAECRGQLTQALGEAHFAELCEEGRTLDIGSVLAADGSWQMHLTAVRSVPFRSRS
jgi:predicted ATPase/class 3 adenylate cyclase